MLRGYQVNVVDASQILQLDVPLSQFFGRQMEAVSLVCDIIVLAKDATQVASTEENTATAVMSLNARFLAEVRRDRVHDYICADETGATPLESVHGAQAWAEIAITEVSIRL